MLYSQNGQHPTTLPFRIVLSNGRTRTDPSTFTTEEIADAGYFAVEHPPQVDYPNKLEWTGTEWIVRPPNDIETLQRIQQIQQQCKQILFDTDYKVIKAVEQGTPIDPVIATYRQQLRDLYNNVVDPWNVVVPTLENPQEELEPNETPFSDDTLQITEENESSVSNDVN
jgi:hypothetical protein